MAEGGSLARSVKGSDDVYDYKCSDCLRFCPDCNKYLCVQCYVCDHDVIGRRNMDSLGQSSKRVQFDPCQKHTGQLLQLYCRKHDVVCCPLCSQSDHKSCGDSVYIPLVANANENKNKAGLTKVNKDLGELHLNADKVSEDKTTKLTDLDQTEKRLVSGVRARKVKHGQCQGLGSQPDTSNKPYRTIKRTSFNVRTKQDEYRCCIEGMCMMPSGDLILADNYNNSLKKVSSQYEVTDSCSLTASPNDVCPTEAGQVAVALRDQTVQLVTVATGSMSCISSFSADHYCNSLAYSNKCLYITSQFGIALYVYNLAGTQLRVIFQDQHENRLFSHTRYITTSCDGERLHITHKNGLVTMDTRGNLVTRFTFGKLRNNYIFSVCTDGDGNVFVGGYGCDSVLQVGGEADKKIAELLLDPNGLPVDVYALCFDSAHTRLLVSSSVASDTVHVLQLST